MTHKTEYLVLHRTRAVHKAAEAATTSPSYEQWELIDTVNASSSEAAIRNAKPVADRTGNGTVDPVLVAVPARSWQPRKVKVETSTRVKLEDA